MMTMFHRIACMVGRHRHVYEFTYKSKQVNVDLPFACWPDGSPLVADVAYSQLVTTEKCEHCGKLFGSTVPNGLFVPDYMLRNKPYVRPEAF